MTTYNVWVEIEVLSEIGGQDVDASHDMTEQIDWGGKVGQYETAEDALDIANSCVSFGESLTPLSENRRLNNVQQT